GGSVCGTSHDGGGHGAGAVFRLRTDGTGFAVLHSFDGTDGSGPFATPIVDGSGNLYGTTGAGGPAGDGVVFTVKTDGTGYSVLHAFGPGGGIAPYASLALDASPRLHRTSRARGSR